MCITLLPNKAINPSEEIAPRLIKRILMTTNLLLIYFCHKNFDCRAGHYSVPPHFLTADTPDMHTLIPIELTDAHEFKICNQMPSQPKILNNTDEWGGLKLNTRVPHLTEGRQTLEQTPFQPLLQVAEARTGVSVRMQCAMCVLLTVAVMAAA